jgi:hypothetical protein
MWIYILFTKILCVSSYVLLNNYQPKEIVKLFSFCPSVKPSLRETCEDVITNLNQYDILQINLKQGYTQPIYQNGINEICHFDGAKQKNNYGYTTTQGNNETDIFISDDLLYTPTTMYNVVYHEFIHSLGLNHTDIDGIMNYKIRVNTQGRVLEDTNKLYLSLDDIRGLRYIKNSMCKCA